jgi:Ferredoxin-like domain in Api92-like protein
MPNWTTNTIRALGTPQDLRAFVEAVKWEDKIFDFNRFIPMPELLKHTGSGRITIGGEQLESWYILDHTQPFPRAEHVRRFTADEEAFLKAIGYRNWYEWSWDNWGTKWNARYEQLIDSAIDYGYVEITFETAWAAPLPVFAKMFDMFPHISFICVWTHEGESKRHSLKRYIGNRVEG